MKAFFIIAPFLFLVSHAYTMAHFALLADKAKRFHLQLKKKIDGACEKTHDIREGIRLQLPINLFVQFLAGPEDIREGPFSILLWATAWATLVAGPVLVLLLLQLQFLPYHDTRVSWWHRLALIFGLALIWWLWMKILSGRSSLSDASLGSGHTGTDRWTRFKNWFLWLSRYVLAWPLTGAIVLFSCCIATFPGEWREYPYSFAQPFEWKAATEFIFEKVDALNGVITGNWPANTLRLKEFDIYDGLKVDDLKKLDWKQYTIDLQFRHLEHADLRFTKFTKANMKGAFLEGAYLSEGQIRSVTFEKAHLQDASLESGHFQGAVFDEAHLQGSLLDSADLQGASLGNTDLQGASLAGTELEGANLKGAHLQGAWLVNANLHAALLSGASLQGASLKGANLFAAAIDFGNLEGASLNHAHMQGADLTSAVLRATDLSGAFLWRTDWGGSLDDTAMAESLSFGTLYWEPLLGVPQTLQLFGVSNAWTDHTYNRLVDEVIKGIPNEANQREEALKRFARLKCKGNDDKSLASCNVNARATAEVQKWRTLLEKARAADTPAYQRVLAEILRGLVCRGDPNAIYILRGLSRVERGNQQDQEIVYYNSRLFDTGGEAATLTSHIMSPPCRVSAALTEDDKAKLLQITQERRAVAEEVDAR